MSNYIPGGAIVSYHHGDGVAAEGPLQKIGLGAVAQGTLFNYRAAAEPLVSQIFSVNPFATHAVITFNLDGKNPVLMPFSDQGAAGDAFEDVIASPGSRAYVAEFDRNGIVGEQFFAATSFFETRFTFEKLKSAAPWIIAALVVVGGAYYLSKKKPTGRARARSRVRGAIARARRRLR